MNSEIDVISVFIYEIRLQIHFWPSEPAQKSPILSLAGLWSSVVSVRLSSAELISLFITSAGWAWSKGFWRERSLSSMTIVRKVFAMSLIWTKLNSHGRPLCASSWHFCVIRCKKDCETMINEGILFSVKCELFFHFLVVIVIVLLLYCR